MDYSLPGSSVHGISQARVLEWGAIAFSRLDLGQIKIHEPKSSFLVERVNLEKPGKNHLDYK